MGPSMETSMDALRPRWVDASVLGLRVVRPGRPPGIQETRKPNTGFRHFSGHRQTVEMVHVQYNFERPRSGRKPIKIVSHVYLLDNFPMPRKKVEIICFLYPVRVSEFPRFQGLYQARPFSSPWPSSMETDHPKSDSSQNVSKVNAQG